MGNATVHPTSLWLPKKCPKNRPFFEKFDITPERWKPAPTFRGKSISR